MLNELDARKFIRNKRYALWLGGSLCAFTVVMILLEHLFGAAEKYLFTTLGTELLLYMLLNAISCLIVDDMWQHVKRTVPVYAGNLLIISAVLYIVVGAGWKDHRTFFPALEALIFCFFASMVLILVIRSVATFLKQE